MNDNLLRYNDKQKYLIFDFETCNLNLVSQKNRPWQLSYIVATKNKILKKADHFLKWKDLKVSDGAARATRFDFKKYKNKCEDPKPVLEEFDRLLYDKKHIVVGHNLLGFDVYVHNNTRKHFGFKTDYSYVNRLIDTNCLSKAYRENIKYDKKDSLTSWQLRLNSYIKRGSKTNLAAMLKEFSVDFDPDKLHDSMYDIEMNFELFKKIIWKVDI